MTIPGYDRYWLDYQARHDPQWRDEDYEDYEYEQDEDAFWNEVDYEVDENILARGENG